MLQRDNFSPSVEHQNRLMKDSQRYAFYIASVCVHALMLCYSLCLVFPQEDHDNVGSCPWSTRGWPPWIEGQPAGFKFSNSRILQGCYDTGTTTPPSVSDFISSCFYINDLTATRTEDFDIAKNTILDQELQPEQFNEITAAIFSQNQGALFYWLRHLILTVCMKFRPLSNHIFHGPGKRQPSTGEMRWSTCL